MLTKIPFWRDIVLSSFSCSHCNTINNSIQSANRVQEQGVKLKLKVVSTSDLNRELVKSDYATFRIPIVDFEIPALTQKGRNDAFTF